MSLGLPDGMLGVAWPSIRATFGLPLDALGLLLATFATGYFVSSAVSGRVLSRFGIGTVLAASCAMTATALLGYALSPAWLGMVALGSVLGIGAGTIDAGLNTYAAVAHGARALNWMHAAFGAGAAIGPLVMTAILGAGLSWSLGYVVVALVQLGLAAGFVVTRKRYVQSQPSSASASEHGGSARGLLRNPLAWISLGLFFVYVGLEAGAGQWSFSLFTLSRGAPVAVAGVLVSAYWACMTVGSRLNRTPFEMPPGKFCTCLTHSGADVAAPPAVGGATSPTVAASITAATNRRDPFMSCPFRWAHRDGPRRLSSARIPDSSPAPG